MSGPKTVSYTVDRDAVRRQAQARENEQARQRRHEQLAAKEARRAAKEAERKRIEEERRQRQAQQRNSLEVGEIKWRAEKVHKQLVVLKEEILRWQSLFPGRLELSLQVVAPPPGDNQDQLQRYVADSNALIQSTEQQLMNVRPVFETELATRSMAEAMGKNLLAPGGLCRKFCRPWVNRLHQFHSRRIRSKTCWQNCVSRLRLR